MVYSIENTSVHNYNLTNNDHLNANFKFGLRAYNPNKRISIYYDNIEVKLFFNYQPISSNDVEPFFQPHRNVTRLDLSLPAKDVVLYDDIAREFKTERSAGVVEVEVKIRAKIRFKVGVWKSVLKTGIESPGSIRGGGREAELRGYGSVVFAQAVWAPDAS
ncbi:PREDICTED: uncharacterized protein At1g08160-like [Nicotiana attenuata]|uniref:uncharacterized protein At1g08160-like n=1 Tax=Nicotiana attenuata TaxID=49451 RepID=UPI000904C206|nr:PREDICTED: uncharacterized protein At1g08160-like [Nicotiana attenuata]